MFLGKSFENQADPTYLLSPIRLSSLGGAPKGLLNGSVLPGIRSEGHGLALGGQACEQVQPMGRQFNHGPGTDSGRSSRAAVLLRGFLLTEALAQGHTGMYVPKA